MLDLLELCLAGQPCLHFIINHLLVDFTSLSAHQLVLRQGLDIVNANTLLNVPIREENAH